MRDKINSFTNGHYFVSKCSYVQERHVRELTNAKRRKVARQMERQEGGKREGREVRKIMMDNVFKW